MPSDSGESTPNPVTSDSNQQVVPRLSRFQLVRLLFSLAISIALLLYVVRGIDFAKVAALAGNSNLLLVALAAMLYYASYIARAFRWKAMLRGIGTDVPFSLAISIILASFAVNCIVPAKAGDIYRCLSVSRKKTGDFFALLGSVIAERVADLICVLLVLLACTGMLQFDTRGLEGGSPLAGKLALTAAFSVTLLFVIVLFVQNLDKLLNFLVPSRFKERVVEIRRGFRMSYARLLSVMVLSAAVWALELGSFYVVLKAADIHIQASHAVLTSAAATLSNAVPFTPGGLGIYELAARELLSAFSVQPEAAIAAILLIRIVNYWSLMVVGAAMTMLLYRLRRT